MLGRDRGKAEIIIARVVNAKFPLPSELFCSSWVSLPGANTQTSGESKGKACPSYSGKSFLTSILHFFLFQQSSPPPVSFLFFKAKSHSTNPAVRERLAL